MNIQEEALQATELKEISHSMPIDVNARVRKRRQALRDAGLRPVQIWVPDTRNPGFDEECRRQSRLLARADAEEHDHLEFMDAALADLGTDEG